MNDNKKKGTTVKKIISLITAVIVAICIATPVTASASENVLHGIDVSNWQRGINCATIPGDFVIIKVSEGVGYTDPNWEACANAAYSAGKKIGLYHFARPEYGNNAYSEANFFSAKISGWRGRAIAVLDYEMTTNVSWARAWLDSVASSFGSNPWIYLSAAAVRGADWSSVSRRYGLWIAGYYYGYRNFYGYAPYNLPYGIGSWKNVAAFQYTSSGRLTGWNGNLDLSVFYGSRETWDTYARNGKAPSAPVVSNPATNNRPSQANNMCVRVQSGDSLSSIAARNGGSWNEWHGYSSGNPNVIYAGEVVCRSVSAPVVSGFSVNTYVVRGGDTLSGIASKYGTTYQELARINVIGNPNLIYAGQTIRIR